MSEGAGPNRRETLRLVTDYSAGTVELGISVAVGAGIGYWLDGFVERRFQIHTSPWLTLFWLLCGVFAGFRALLRVVRRLEEQDRQRNGESDAP